MKPRTILLVEDNASEVDLARRAFNRARLANELVVAEDGQEALDYLFAAGRYLGRTDSELPALMLLDLKLPKVPGLEVLRRIRSDPRTRRLPIVIFTTSKQEQDVAAGFDLGVNSYIRKPVDFTQFSKAMEQVALYWLVLNEPPSNVTSNSEPALLT